MATLAIIGGTGLAKLFDGRVQKVGTNYGGQSVFAVKIRDKECFILLRHGEGHNVLPHDINHRKHIEALACKLEATHILSLAAVGSTKRRHFKMFSVRYKVGDIVLVEDLVRQKDVPTFIKSPQIIHPDMSEPYSKEFAGMILQAAANAGVKIKKGAVLADTRGPPYETKTEVRIYRKNGIDLLGMTSVSETVLENEIRAIRKVEGNDLPSQKLYNATLAIVSNYGTGLVKSVSHDDVAEVVGSREESIRSIICEIVPLLGQ